MSELLGIARFRFLEGKREEYLRLSDQATELVRANEPLDHADHPQRVTSSALQSVQRYVTGFTARQSGFRRGHALTTMLTAAEFPTEVVKSRVAK